MRSEKEKNSGKTKKRKNEESVKENLLNIEEMKCCQVSQVKIHVTFSV